VGSKQTNSGSPCKYCKGTEIFTGAASAFAVSYCHSMTLEAVMEKSQAKARTNDVVAASNSGTSPYVTVKEAARWMRVHERTVWRLISQGKIARKRAGNRVRIEVAELERYMAGSE
jgi:excisionase family DNA binding protein